MKTVTQYGFFIDTTKCSGCKTCQVSCKDDKDLPEGINFRRVYEYVGGTWELGKDQTFKQDVYGYYTSIACNHCDEPACIKVCPKQAYSKDEHTGLVLHDQSVCIGCRRCTGRRGCPYDAPQFNTQTGVMHKCDGCIDRIKLGRKPICVDSCPLRALDFGPMNELRARYGSTADIQPLPSSKVTKPNLVIKVNRNAQDGGTILNNAEV